MYNKPMRTKQVKALAKMVENGGDISGKELKDIGYSDAIAHNPNKVINSKGIQDGLLAHGITTDAVLAPIGKALVAKTIVHIGQRTITDVDGNTISEPVTMEIDNIELQLRGSEKGMKLLGLDKLDKDPVNPINPTIDNTALMAAIENGDMVELQRIIFNKVD